MWPVIVLAVVKLIPVSGFIKAVIALGAAFPPAATAFVLAANGLIVTALLSMASIPVYVMLIFVLVL